MLRAAIGIFVILATIITLGFLKPAHSQETSLTRPEITRYTIRDDPGGRLDEYNQSIVELKKSNSGIRLDGMCASACTMMVFPEFGLDICTTSNGSLGIHHPFMMSPDNQIGYSIPAIKKAQEVWSEVFYKKYPQWLQKYIDDNGGAPDVYTGAQPSDMLRVPFTELSKHMEICND